jgi:TatD DNase family protein
MIDSHAHLDFPQFDSDRDEVIRRGFENGLEAVINIGTDLETSRRSIALASRFDNICATAGVHPHDAQACPKDYLGQLRGMIKADTGNKIVAIGEIGLDYYRDLSPRDIQRRVFGEQLALAKDLDLPVVVHIREAMDDSLKILEESGVMRGVLHSFPGNIDEARAGIDLGFFISFAGPITYPKSSRPEVAAAIPLSRILVETDSPYLTPQAFRGKRNKPEYVKYVIAKLAEIFAPYSFEDIERITSHNARRLFNLPNDKNGKIVYRIRRSLYINLTNRCTCNCGFCVRHSKSGGYVAGHYLFLKSEPAAPEVLAAIENENNFDEVVFCGLGEPTLRLKELLEIAVALGRKKISLRLDTNGHGSLINKTDLPRKLAGLIDKVSVSLNAQDADTYVKLCRPDRGKEAYQAMLDFIKGCVANGIAAEISVVELPEVDIESCRRIAQSLGATFRIRKYYPVDE